MGQPVRIHLANSKCGTKICATKGTHIKIWDSVACMLPPHCIFLPVNNLFNHLSPTSTLISASNDVFHLITKPKSKNQRIFVASEWDWKKWSFQPFGDGYSCHTPAAYTIPLGRVEIVLINWRHAINVSFQVTNTNKTYPVMNNNYSM